MWKVLRGVWGATIGAVSGALGGLVAPITAVYDKVSGQPTTGKKILWGLGAAFFSPVILTVGGLYGVIGFFAGAVLGGYSSQATVNPIYIAKATYDFFKNPVLMNNARKELFASENIFTFHVRLVLAARNKARSQQVKQKAKQMEKHFGVKEEQQAPRSITSNGNASTTTTLEEQSKRISSSATPPPVITTSFKNDRQHAPSVIHPSSPPQHASPLKITINENEDDDKKPHNK